MILNFLLQMLSFLWHSVESVRLCVSVSQSLSVSLCVLSHTLKKGKRNRTIIYSIVVVFVCLGGTNIVPVILSLPIVFAHLGLKCFIKIYHNILSSLLPSTSILFQAPCKEGQDQA